MYTLKFIFQTLWKLILIFLSKLMGRPHICGMELNMTHMEAWKDFYKWMESRRDAGEISKIPKDVQEAKYAANGDRKHGLGEKRIKNLLARYAPDRYEFRETVILKD